MLVGVNIGDCVFRSDSVNKLGDILKLVNVPHVNIQHSTYTPFNNHTVSSSAGLASIITPSICFCDNAICTIVFAD